MATNKSSTQNKAPAVETAKAATAAPTENDNLNNPPKTEPVSDAEREAKAEELAKQNEARAKADAEAKDSPDDVAESNAEAAIAPVIEGMEDQPEVQERVRQALGNAGETPKPTMVNGRYVGDKKFNEKTGEW